MGNGKKKISSIHRKKMPSTDGAAKAKNLFGLSVDDPRRDAMKRCVLIKTNSEMATGIVIQPGVVLACGHAIEWRSPIMVNGICAKVVKVDTELDIMLLSVKTPKVRPIKLATSVKIDEPVFYVGNPLKHAHLIAHGHIIDITNGHLYSDIPCSYGASGSGVYNDNGELVGIVTAMENLGAEGSNVPAPFTIAVPMGKVRSFLTRD